MIGWWRLVKKVYVETYHISGFKCVCLKRLRVLLVCATFSHPIFLTSIQWLIQLSFNHSLFMISINLEGSQSFNIAFEFQYTVSLYLSWNYMYVYMAFLHEMPWYIAFWHEIPCQWHSYMNYHVHGILTWNYMYMAYWHEMLCTWHSYVNCHVHGILTYTIILNEGVK